MRTLLIGGNGPTGPLIIEGLLQRNAEVSVLNRGRRTGPPRDDIEHIVADPHFAEPLQAALEGRSFDLVIATYGRLRIMPPILAKCTDRVITIGGTAYADTGGRPATEDAPRDTSNTIVRRMVETEELLASAHEQGLFCHTHIRYPLLWGPGQIAPKEWSIVRRVLDHRPFIPMVDGGRTIETKCFVANAAAAVLRAIDRPKESAGRTYHVGDAESPDDRTRVRDLCRALGAPEMGLLDLPRAATGPAAFWAVGRDLDYGRENRMPHTNHNIIDSSRIRSELGHRDVVSYEEAVTMTAQHYLAHPLERGGEMERRLGDPFDYAAEDAYAQALSEFLAATDRVGFQLPGFRHQYDHPRQPQPQVSASPSVQADESSTTVPPR